MEKKRCLVLMPIGVTQRQEGPAFAALYQHMLLPALRATGFPLHIFRGDEVMRAGISLYEGRLWLHEPHVVIADLTTQHSGVVHDLVLRDFLAARTVLLSQQAADIPPQFSSYRQILYDLSEAGMVQLSRELTHHLSAILAVAWDKSPPTDTVAN